MGNITDQLLVLPVECNLLFRVRLNPIDPFKRGLGQAEALADEIETDEYAAKFQKRFFFNDATPNLIIGTETTPKRAPPSQLHKLVAPLCQQAMDLGFNGLIIESHCNPDCAWSDAAQQVTPDVLDYILNLLVIRKETQSTENLSELRKQIDECDNNLIQELAKRMRVAREIGTYKKEHDMTILQTGRYNEILEKRGSQGALCGMDAEFIKKVFEAIHEESVRQQMEIINK